MRLEDAICVTRTCERSGECAGYKENVRGYLRMCETNASVRCYLSPPVHTEDERGCRGSMRPMRMEEAI